MNDGCGKVKRVGSIASGSSLMDRGVTGCVGCGREAMSTKPGSCTRAVDNVFEKTSSTPRSGKAVVCAGGEREGYEGDIGSSGENSDVVYSGVDEDDEDSAEDSGSSSLLVDAEPGGDTDALVLSPFCARRPFSWNSSSPPATRWNSASGNQRLAWRGERGRRTWLSPPHIAEDLDVARDLFLGAVDAILVEMVDEELVAPPTATAGVGGPR